MKTKKTNKKADNTIDVHQALSDLDNLINSKVEIVTLAEKTVAAICGWLNQYQGRTQDIPSDKDDVLQGITATQNMMKDLPVIKTELNTIILKRDELAQFVANSSEFKMRRNATQLSVYNKVVEIATMASDWHDRCSPLIYNNIDAAKLLSQAIQEGFKDV